jgi:hypothetical protein
MLRLNEPTTKESKISEQKAKLVCIVENEAG